MSDEKKVVAQLEKLVSDAAKKDVLVAGLKAEADAAHQETKVRRRIYQSDSKVIQSAKESKLRKQLDKAIGEIERLRHNIMEFERERPVAVLSLSITEL